MKLVHISDLHIGKRLSGYSFAEDQRYILDKIIAITEEEKADALLICGDVYDRSVPSAEAVSIFDDFLAALAEKKINTFIISGNHDSAERLAYASGFMSKNGIIIETSIRNGVSKHTLTDEYGETDIYMLPFVRAADVSCYTGEELKNENEALHCLLSGLDIDESRRNVIMAHQFITNASVSDSEEIIVGLTDNVDAEVFDRFDYVALGHIHGPQSIGRDEVRYCGTPLKYSVSESEHKKSVTVVTLGPKGSVKIDERELVPLRDLRKLRGTFAQLLADANEKVCDDYISITLTDDHVGEDAKSRLLNYYPNMIELRVDNERTRAAANAVDTITDERVLSSPLTLLEEYFVSVNGQDPDELQLELMKEIVKEVWEDKDETD